MPSDTDISKFLSYALRHAPDKVGIVLDSAGWTRIDQLLSALEAHDHLIDRMQLQRIVDENPKKRFAISDDGLRIRANQGHSVSVELGVSPATPPSTLFHGTATKVLPRKPCSRATGTAIAQ